MKVCQVGGSVIYSTCTLSPAQNQLLLCNFAKNHGNEFRMAFVDLKPLKLLLDELRKTSEHFGLNVFLVPLLDDEYFNNQYFLSNNESDVVCNRVHGLLFVPTVSSNHGPRFIAKLKRIG